MADSWVTKVRYSNCRSLSSIFSPSLSPLKSMEEELGVEKLVPVIGETRETPVNAVGVAFRVSQLLRRRRIPLSLVDLCVGILPALGQPRNVEDSYGESRFLH